MLFHGSLTTETRSIHRKTTERDSRTRNLKLEAGKLRRALARDVRIHHKVERLDDEGPHLATIDDGVDHAVLQKKLGSLKVLGQLLPDRLFDHARAGETYESFRLSQDQITEHRKTCSHASGSWICQHRDKWQVSFFQSRQRRGYLSHLHQRQHAFLHA